MIGTLYHVTSGSLAYLPTTVLVYNIYLGSEWAMIDFNLKEC